LIEELVPYLENVVLDVCLKLEGLNRSTLVILYFLKAFRVLFIVDSFAPPESKQKDEIFNTPRGVKGPLDLTINQVKQVSRVLLDPTAESIVVVSCHEEDEDINVLDLLFNTHCVLVDNLPSERKGN